MQNMNALEVSEQKISVPNVPVLVVKNNQIVWLDVDGVFEELSIAEVQRKLSAIPLVCHMPSTAARLKLGKFHCFDVLELFAFVHPAKFCTPSPTGLAEFFGFTFPQSLEDEASILLSATEKLLLDLRNKAAGQKSNPLDMVQAMQGWVWAPFVASALKTELHEHPQSQHFKVWRQLPEWSDHAPEQPAGHYLIEEEETLQTLDEMLALMSAEKREAQREYLKDSLPAFKPRSEQGKPNIVIAEAGTGTGKTLGYLALAKTWAQKNQGSVWVSTYTKNLQRQISDELKKAYPNELEKKQKTVIRKGRENYLCLLNYEDIIKRASLPDNIGGRVLAGLLSRWVAETENGDIKGGDFPGWLTSLFGYARIQALTDTRGECIHAACPHYNKCFIEKSVRQSKRAEIVVANHALVMIQNALSGEFLDEVTTLPTRYVFDEAHHLFHAADGAFAYHLSGQETLELRRWIFGNESPNKFRASRSRGLKARMDELVSMDDRISDYLVKILYDARILTSFGWLQRLQENNPQGACEEFLFELRKHVLAKASTTDIYYSLESEKVNLQPELIDKSENLQISLKKIKNNTERLIAYLEDYLNKNQDKIEPSDKQKHEGLIKSLKRRMLSSLEAWIDMLQTVQHDTPDDFFDWFGIERMEGHETDIGFFRHWIDPMKPFVKTLEQQIHGSVFTSATLTEGNFTDEKNERENKLNAEDSLGIQHFSKGVKPSWSMHKAPFEYKKQAKIFVVTDLESNNIPRIASAYHALFNASKGGGLGLFTSIQKLKSVYENFSNQFSGFPHSLYAQHIDGIDTPTLIDIFRAEKDACLFGTDAIRDGVDIPGESLRMLIFDKVPWPKPSLLHKVRRQNFGAKRYDEMVTRLKIKQAFGRLIRNHDDKGIFIMLESRLPTRICDAFPPECEVQRLPLKEVIDQVKDFFKA